MAQTFEERVEEVLGALHGMAWPLLEEPEKKKIVAKIVRGIDRYGDKQAAWGRAMGVAHQTLSDRIAHFRRSEPIDGIATAKKNEEKKLSHARTTFRDPALVAKLMEDPATRRSIAKAAIQHQAEVEQVERQAQSRRAPGLVHGARFNDVAGDLLRVRHLYAQALNAARELDLDAGEADALAEDIEKIAQITGWFESWLESGAVDFDTELDRILEG